MEEKKISDYFEPSFMLKDAVITQLKRKEDDSFYQVWQIDSDSGRYIIKEAKAYEAELYRCIFAKFNKNIPAVYQSAVIDKKTYLLMEYIRGEDLCKCSRHKLVLALDALITLQKELWESTAYTTIGYCFEASLKEREDRGKYLSDAELETIYKRFLEIYAAVPRTLCHDDLLPFNILVSADEAFLIDWEYGGILPYPISIARLIAHGEGTEDALFYMTQEDKEFAIAYYYDKLLRDKGIPWEEWRKTIEYFLFYEYCEWVYLGNKYKNHDNGYYTKYLRLAKQQAHRIQKLNYR